MVLGWGLFFAADAGRETSQMISGLFVTVSYSLFMPAPLSGVYSRCICGLGVLGLAGAGSGGRMQTGGCLCLVAPVRALIGF